MVSIDVFGKGGLTATEYDVSLDRLVGGSGGSSSPPSSPLSRTNPSSKGSVAVTGGKNAYIQGLHGDYIVIF